MLLKITKIVGITKHSHINMQYASTVEAVYVEVEWIILFKFEWLHLYAGNETG